MPTLERDARAITEAARLRGVALAEGRWPGRLRRAAPLALPLLGSSLERGLDVAEAMTARGYGSGPRTRVAEPGWDAAERWTAAIGAALAVVAARRDRASAWPPTPSTRPSTRSGRRARWPSRRATLAALAGAAWILRR